MMMMMMMMTTVACLAALAAHVDHGDIARPPQSALVASPGRHIAGDCAPSTARVKLLLLLLPLASFRTRWCFITRSVVFWEAKCCAVLHGQRARRDRQARVPVSNAGAAVS